MTVVNIRKLSVKEVVMDSACSLSVVVPCFNEASNIHILLSRLQSICHASVGDSYEIVLVDDGSLDETAAEIERAAGADPHVMGVVLSRNFGHQRALSAGLANARGSRIFILDADLQDPPELLPEMMHLMDTTGAEVVYGVRSVRLGESWLKRATAAGFYRLLNRLTDVPIPPDAGEFRLITRRILAILDSMPEEHRFIRGMIGWIGFRQVAFHYERQKRHEGTSHYPLRKMTALAVDALTSNSIRPLQLASYLAFVAGASALLLLLYALTGFAAGGVRGWMSLMSVVLLLGAAQLFVLGVIGEYFGRLYLQARHRPLYVIDRIVGTRTSIGNKVPSVGPLGP
jgi:glycosyltransferase involved in cell wall biosynthesis